MENISLLQNLYVFKELTRFELIQVNKIVRAERFPAGTPIISESERGDKMYVVKSGLVHVYIESTEDRKEVLATLGSGDHFGEMALIDNGPRSANVEAADDVELLVIDSVEFREVLDAEKDIKVKVYEAFLRTLCARLRATNDAAVIYRIQAELQN